MMIAGTNTERCRQQNVPGVLAGGARAFSLDLVNIVVHFSMEHSHAEVLSKFIQRTINF